MRDVVFILFRRRWIALAISLPIILAGGFSLFGQTRMYTATARDVVQLNDVDQPRWNVAGPTIDYDRELSTLSSIAMSVPVAQIAAQALQDSIPMIKQLDPKLNLIDQPGELADYLLKGNTVMVVGETRILEFSFRSTHPRVALMAVGALRDAFEEYQVHGKKNQRAVAYYQDQIDTVSAQIDSLLALNAKVTRDAGYFSVTDDFNHDAGLLAGFSGDLVTASSQRMALDEEYAKLSEALKGDPREFPIGESESKSTPLVYWRSTVSDREVELIKERAVHTESSIPVQRVEKMLKESLERLKREEEAYVQSVGIARLAAVEKEKALQAAVLGMQARRYQAPEASQKIGLIQSQVSSLRKLLEELQGKLGEVRISQEADERISAIVAVTAPELAPFISGGKTLIYFVLVVILAIAFGIAAAFIQESLDHRILEPRDVESRLNLPVFASVTKAE